MFYNFIYSLIQDLVNSFIGFVPVHMEYEKVTFPSSFIFSNSFAEHLVKIFRWRALNLNVHSYPLRILFECRFWLGRSGVGLRFYISNNFWNNAYAAGSWGHFELHGKRFLVDMSWKDSARETCVCVVAYFKIWLVICRWHFYCQSSS